MIAEVRPLPAEMIRLSEALGRVLAEDVVAPRDQPPSRTSAMDGWAVKAAEAPADLAIVGESAAGRGFPGRLEVGQAIRIFTGAAMPDGAEAVVIQEDAQQTGDRVRVPAVQQGRHLRPAGCDFRAGETLLTRGLTLDPWRMGLAACAGRAELSVRAAPRVAILSTGQELVEPPAVAGAFEIYESNSSALVPFAQRLGARAVRLKPAPDVLDAVLSALGEADADLVVTTGGASVGDYDLVRAAAERLGARLCVASVNVRPGKPTFFGVLGDGRLLLGLPGSPSAAFVCAVLFLEPLIAAFQGAPTELPVIQAALLRRLPENGPREHWMRARLNHADGLITAEPWPDQDTSLVRVFAVSDALLRRPPRAPPGAVGDLVEVLPLRRL